MRTSTGTAALAVTGLAALAAAQSCATGVHIIAARGTEEPQGLGREGIVVEQLISDIPGSDYSDVVYPASYDIPTSPDTGTQDVLQQAEAYAASCPDSRMVLMGYSQGAQIVANAVSGGGVATLGPYPPTSYSPALSDSVMSKVAAIVVFGDVNFIADEPYTTDGCTVSSKIARSGSLATTWNSYSAKMQSWCASGDPVCCGTGTDQNAHLSYFTQETADSVSSFVQGLVADDSSQTSGAQVTPSAPISADTSSVSSTSVSKSTTTGTTTSTTTSTSTSSSTSTSTSTNLSTTITSTSTSTSLSTTVSTTKSTSTSTITYSFFYLPSSEISVVAPKTTIISSVTSMRFPNSTVTTSSLPNPPSSFPTSNPAAKQTAGVLAYGGAAAAAVAALAAML